MSEELTTWSQLVERAAVDPGDTPGDASIQRIISMPVGVTSGNADAGFQGCGTGCGCAAQN